MVFPGLLHEVCGLVLVKGECTSLLKSLEAKGNSDLDHPNIPQAFGWGKSQFYEYLALELLDCDLFSRFREEPLTRRNFVSLVLQMVRHFVAE